VDNDNIDGTVATICSESDWEKYETICEAIDTSLADRGYTLSSEKCRGLSRILYVHFVDHPTITIDAVVAYLDPFIENHGLEVDKVLDQARQTDIQRFQLFGRALLIVAICGIVISVFFPTVIGYSIAKPAIGVLLVGGVVELIVIFMLRQHPRETITTGNPRA